MATLLKLQGRVFFTGDFHYNHENIIKYSSRPFANAQEMDARLIQNTNDLVMPEDTLVCVGDWLFARGGDYYEMAKAYRDRIACRKVYLVWGNHDRCPNFDEIMKVFYRVQDLNPAGDDLAEQVRHIQQDANNIRHLRFQRLFSGCYDLLEFEYMGRQGVAGHYAYRVWNKSHHGRLHLYGHSHYSLPDDPDALSMDVGVDAAAHYRSKGGTLRPEDYGPLAWVEILTHMAKKTFKPIDHHGGKR